MRFSLLAMSFLACAAPLWAQTAPRRVAKTPATRAALPTEISRVAARAKGSVVLVACQKPRSEATKDEKNDDAASKTDPQEPVVSFGSGFVCRADGLILTNYHLVRGASLIEVSFSSQIEDAEQIPARVVGFDAELDLAVLGIKRAGLTPLPLGESGAAALGQLTLAIGGPLGSLQSVTLGVLAGRGRGILDAPSEGAFLVTDASLSTGSSGGPLLDLNGRVIGLNTEHVPHDEGTPGLGFSIPADLIRRVLPQLMAGKVVKHGFLGATPGTLSREAAREFGLSGGVLLRAVETSDDPDSDSNPAQTAGLREGDIILSAEGKPLRRGEQLESLIEARAPGEMLRLAVARPDFAGAGNVQRFLVSLRLGEDSPATAVKAPAAKAPAAAAPSVPLNAAGLGVGDAKDLDAALKERYSLDGSESGALITSVTPFSRADEATLDEGDRIVRARLDGKWHDIASAASFKALLSGAAAGAHVLLDVRDSDDAGKFLVLILPVP